MDIITIIQVFLIGLGLSMDAFAISMTNGMCYKELKLKDNLLIALSFGLFQGIMPLIGFFIGSIFSSQIAKFDHWIALILLSFIGIKMILDGLKHNDFEVKPFKLKLIFIQGIATSIDALAIGIGFVALNINIYSSSVIIAITTFVLCLLAIYLGKIIGNKLNSKAEIFGGTILVLIGLKIFLEHIFS